MKAGLFTRFGGPEVLHTGDVPTPTWNAGQMLVRTYACGVCGHDLLNRQGHFPATRLPCVMGHEISGVVEEVGPLVKQFAPGDRVALTQRISCGVCPACRAGRDNLCRSGPGFYGEELSGGYGEFVVASPRNAVSLPPEIDLDVGAILSCAVGTGFHALGRARLTPGDTVVITAASGGVGIHTVELARLMGYRVIAATSSEEKVPLLTQAGADHVLVTAGADFHKAVRELTDGRGADAVIEITGTPTFASSLRSLALGGRLVMVGNVQPGNVPLNPAVPILREVEIVGSGHALVSDLRRVIDLVARGRIHPRIAARLPVSEAAKAHALLTQRRGTGRVVLMHH